MAGGIAGWCMVLVAAGAHGDAAKAVDPVVVARQACQANDLDLCVAAGAKALAQPGLDAATREEFLDLTGSAHAVMGDLVAAEDAFKQVLRLNPAHVVPEDLPPKIMTVWRNAQAAVQQEQAQAEKQALERLRAAVRLDVTAAASQAGGTPWKVAVVVTAPVGSVDRVVLHHRRDGAPVFSSQPLVLVGSAYEATLPAALLDAPKGGDLSWFVEVLDAKGQVLASHGAQGTPALVALSPGVSGKGARQELQGGVWGKAAPVVGMLGTGLAGGLGVLLPATVAGVFFLPLCFSWPLLGSAVSLAAAAAGWALAQRSGKRRVPLVPLVVAAVVPTALGACLCAAPFMVSAPFWSWIFYAGMVGADGPKSPQGLVTYVQENIGGLLVWTFPTAVLVWVGTLAGGTVGGVLAGVMASFLGRPMLEGEEGFHMDLVDVDAPVEDLSGG